MVDFVSYIALLIQGLIFLLSIGDMLDEKTAILEGYSSYYSFSNVKTGYSGMYFILLT